MPLPDTATELVQLLGLIPHPEGGFFLETYRSGVEAMSTRGTTDATADGHHLVTTLAAAAQATNATTDTTSNIRHTLTSIYWVPTVASPILMLATNKSVHVHYYQGGRPFEYTVYWPTTGALTTQIVGPDLSAGHVLQFVVDGGCWKCGRLLSSDSNSSSSAFCDYSILAEAVAPGWDACDFVAIEPCQVAALPDATIRTTLQKYVRTTDGVPIDIDSFYPEDE